MAETPQSGPDYSREREWKVVLEQLRSEFRVFGEGLTDLRQRVDRIEGKVDRLETDVAFIKMVLPTVATKDDLKQLEKRLVAIENTR